MLSVAEIALMSLRYGNFHRKQIAIFPMIRINAIIWTKYSSIVAFSNITENHFVIYFCIISSSQIPCMAVLWSLVCTVYLLSRQYISHTTGSLRKWVLILRFLKTCRFYDTMYIKSLMRLYHISCSSVIQWHHLWQACTHWSQKCYTSVTGFSLKWHFWRSN